MKNRSFQVRPRYTPGSPAMVPEVIAERVAAQEKEGYETALSGVYGVRDQERAQALGLEGIVEELVERGNGWDVRDLITGTHRRKEFIRAKDLRQGDHIRRIVSGEVPIDFVDMKLDGRPLVGKKTVVIHREHVAEPVVVIARDARLVVDRVVEQEVEVVL